MAGQELILCCSTEQLGSRFISRVKPLGRRTSQRTSVSIFIVVGQLDHCPLAVYLALVHRARRHPASLRVTRDRSTRPEVSRSSTTDPAGRGYNTARRIIIMSGSLHPAEIHRRRHRQEKRNKLRAKLAAASAGERAAIDAKLQRTYALVPGTKPST